MTTDYQFYGLPQGMNHQEVIDVNDQRIRPGFGFGFGRPGFGFGFGRPGFGLGFLGGLATGALLAPGPGFGYYPPYPYPPYPYPPYPYPYYGYPYYGYPYYGYPYYY